MFSSNKSVFIVLAMSIACLLTTTGWTLSPEPGQSGTHASADDDAAVAPKSLYRPTHDQFNLHLGVGYVLGLGNDLDKNKFNNMGVQGLIGFDLVLEEPVALSFQGGFNTLVGGNNDHSLTSAFVGVGLRFRFLADTSGPLADGGSAAGNLWLDTHFNYINHDYQDHGGYDVGVGYEFALFNNINIGPYARFLHVALGKDDSINYMALSFGLSVSIAGDTVPGDMDQDGIPDELDECPREAGPAENQGCPVIDSDNDGIPDDEDQCPDEPGLPEFGGCPDRDGDGIPDEDDVCPDEAGPAENQGCPIIDSDNDGIPDDEDRCPTDPGTPEHGGCPDRDGDGIPDIDDDCPDERGPTENRGCPLHIRIDADAVSVLTPIEFETRQAVLAENARPVLEELAAIVKAKENTGLTIQVTTDEIKNRKRNQALAQSRADALKAALVEAGLEESRITVSIQDPGASLLSFSLVAMHPTPTTETDTPDENASDEASQSAADDASGDPDQADEDADPASDEKSSVTDTASSQE